MKSTQAAAILIIAFAIGAVAVFALASNVPAEVRPAEEPCYVLPPLAAEPITYRGPSFRAEVVSSPTMNKPQSKLWHNDGAWWAILVDDQEQSTRIYELSDDHSWRRTDALVDPRVDATVDVLWDGDALYVASGHHTHSLRILRYSYDSDSRAYSLDGGFPVTIDGFNTSSVVIAQDGTGRLWVTFVSRPGPDGARSVWAAASTPDQRTWGEPFVIPVPDAAPIAGGLSSVVAFQGHIGVFWSNELSSAFRFAIHRDDDHVEAWTLETPLEGEGMVDNHVSVKADSTGRVFAAIKTARDDHGELAGDALLMLLERAADGSWRQLLVGTVAERLTRPFVLLDEASQHVYVFASRGNAVVYKRASLDSEYFAWGRATDFLRQMDTQMVYGTASKHAVSPDTGIVVLASGEDGYYYHAEVVLPSVATLGNACPTAEHGSDYTSLSEALIATPLGSTHL